jgi:hypothetical protein
VQFPLQVPLQTPAQVPLTVVVVPLATQLPLQVAMHVPAHSTVGAVAVTSHSPLHSAEQEPWHMRTGALTEPWHVPVQLAVQVPESWAGVQLAVTDGGVQLPLAVQFASQLASTSTLTEQPPPEMFSPHAALAETPASSVSARTAVIPAEAALHAAFTSSSSDPPGEVNVACVTPAAERSFAMPVHAIRTDCSIELWMLPSDATADTNAFASPSPLQLEFTIEPSEFVELHPFANTGTAKRKPTATPVFQATILVMRSSPCAKRRERAAPNCEPLA